MVSGCSYDHSIGNLKLPSAPLAWQCLWRPTKMALSITRQHVRPSIVARPDHGVQIAVPVPIRELQLSGSDFVVLGIRALHHFEIPFTFSQRYQ